MSHQRRLDVLLTEREADLTEIPGIGTEDLDLACREAAQHHQAIQPIELDRTVELGEKAALHLGADRVGHLNTSRYRDTDIVEPHSCAIDREAECALVERTQAQVVEQRQHVG